MKLLIFKPRPKIKIGDIVEWGDSNASVAITHIRWFRRTFDGVVLSEPYRGCVARGLDFEGINAYSKRSARDRAPTDT